MKLRTAWVLAHAMTGWVWGRSMRRLWIWKIQCRNAWQWITDASVPVAQEGGKIMYVTRRSGKVTVK